MLCCLLEIGGVERGKSGVSSLHYGLGAILDVWKISSTSQIE